LHSDFFVTLYLVVFRNVEFESEEKISNLTIAYLGWRLKVQQLFDLCNMYYSKKFCLYVYIQDVLKLGIPSFFKSLISNLKPKITKFKIVDSNTKCTRISMKTYAWLVINH